MKTFWELRPGEPDYWIYTDTKTLHELLESVDVFDISDRDLFVSSINEELGRRVDAAPVESLNDGTLTPQRAPSGLTP